MKKNVKIRNTSASSARAFTNRRGRWLHVSQWFQPQENTCPLTGVVTTTYEAQFLDSLGKRPLGKTYNVGSNVLKRFARAAGMSRASLDRDLAASVAL